MIDSIIVIVYLIGILGVGIWSAKGMKSMRDFSVSSKDYPWFIVFATLSASFIGGGFSIGNAEKVFLYGITNIVALWGFSLKEVLVAKFIAPQMYKYPDAISVGDIMGVAYGRFGQVVTGVFAVALCAGIMGAQMAAIGLIFEVFLGIPKIYGILAGCSIIIIYSTLGGMKAVIYTDVIQFIVLVIGLPLTLIFGLSYVGGWSEVVESVPATHFEVLGGKSLMVVVSLFLIFLLGETLVPPYVQRLLIGKSVKDTSKGTFASGLLSIPFLVVTGGIGLVAYTLDNTIAANAAMPYVINTVLPIGIKGVVIAGIISVVMSSADSFLNSASVSFVNDVIMTIRKEKLDDQQGLRWTQLTNLIVGLLSVIFAVSSPSIIDILIYAYYFWAPIILVPLALTILGCKVSKMGFLFGGIIGIIATLLWNNEYRESGLDGLVIGVFANWLAFSITTAASQGKPKARASSPQ